MTRLGMLIVAALVMVALVVTGGLAIGGWDFLRQHVGVLAMAAGSLVLLVTMLWRVAGLLAHGAALAVSRPSTMGQSGAAAAEFVIVVIPFLLLLFGIMQLALASLARVLVSYSAFCAARAAVVFVPEDSGSSSSGSAAGDGANQVGSGSNPRSDFSSSAKMGLLRNAAAYALIPASPSIDVVVQEAARSWPSYYTERLQNGLGPLDFLRSRLGKGGIDGLPPAVRASFDTQVQIAVKAVGEGARSRTQAEAELAGWANGIAGLDALQRRQLISAASDYIDAYHGVSAVPATALRAWVPGAVASTLSGNLARYRGPINASLAAAVPAGGSGGGGPSPYSVDKALDSGFGSSDGAQGALLRSLRKLVYARVATAVTLHDPKTGAQKSSFAWGDPITARVTYLFYCQIPLANRFAGHRYYELPARDLEALATGPLGPVATVGLPGYFMTLTAEHTLTNQGRP
jgi:hypothetical protein